MGAVLVFSDKDIREAAIKFLAMREYGRYELFVRLKQKFKTEDDARLDRIQKTLESLEDAGYLSDRRFTESFVRARIEKGYGPNYIRADLLGRGIDSGIVEEVLRNHENDWLPVLTRLRNKKFAGVPVKDYKTKSKVFGYLARRGFTQGQIRSALELHEDD